MALSLKDLLTPETEDELLERLIAMLAASDFPVTAWLAGGVVLTMLEKLALVYAEAGTRIQSIALGGYLATSKGKWLSLLAQDWFAVDRIAAVATEGYFVLRDAGAGPHVIVPGQLTARYGALLFTNTEGGTLAANGSLSLRWRAKAVGAAYNAVPTGEYLELATSIPGVTVRADPILGTGTWIVAVGADEEPDASLVKRCLARWPKIGRGGGTSACYDAWAREASDQVRKVYVAEHKPVEGKVTVYVYGTTAPVTDGARDAVRDHLQNRERRPLCVAVTAEHAFTTPVAVTGFVYCRATFIGDVLARAAAALSAYEAELDVGEDVIRSEIIERLMGLEGVVDVQLSLPIANALVPDGSIARFTVGLTAATPI